MTKTFREIIEAAEFDHYGVRAHRGEAIVGKTLGCSKVWIDGECTDADLDGISTLAVTAETIDSAITAIRNMYCWDSETIVLVGGYTGSHGEDHGEYIIKDNICLAVLA